MADPQAQPMSASRSAVLSLLQREGPISTDSLAAKLELTGMAVRLHLGALQMGGLAAFETEARPRGRPVQMWRATAKAAARFADSHSALAVDLIAQMKNAFGDDGINRILKLRTAEQEKTYRTKTNVARSLKGKLEQLAKIRSAEGYMAEIRRDETTGDWLFVENHCPICSAAKACMGFCRSELELFHKVLGDEVRVRREEHILTGARRCAYRIDKGG